MRWTAPEEAAYVEVLCVISDVVLQRDDESTI